jgi:hypothetical protein
MEFDSADIEMLMSGWNTLYITERLTQTVASQDRRMNRSHAVGMCNYKAKYSFSLR